MKRAEIIDILKKIGIGASAISAILILLGIVWGIIVLFVTYPKCFYIVIPIIVTLICYKTGESIIND